MPVPLRLHRTYQGDPGNPSLVILHGLFGSSTNWRRIAKAFSTDFYVICLDLRNHGESPWSATMDYASMAEDVAETLVLEAIQNPVVLGHSMGGKAAMTLAQLNLIPIDALIVADIAPVPYTHSHDELIAAMESVDLGTITRRADAEQRLARHLSDATIRQFLLQNLIREAGGYGWRINLAVIQQSLPALLSWDSSVTSSVRSLFIYGEHSNYVNHSGRLAIRKFFPNSELILMPNAGHWLHVEQPALFVRSVIDFLQSSFLSRA